MLPPSVSRGLRRLGADVRTARLKRRLSVRDFAERVGVSTRTITRLERGEAGVGIGTLAMACLVLGEPDRLAQLLDPATDATGLLMEADALPKRIVSRRTEPESRAPADTVGPASDDDGLGF